MQIKKMSTKERGKKYVERSVLTKQRKAMKRKIKERKRKHAPTIAI